MIRVEIVCLCMCVWGESIPRLVEVTTKSRSKAASKTGPSLCSSLKGTRQFLHLFGHRNKQTNKLQHLTVLRLCLQFVTILLCCWARSHAWANPLFVWNTNGQANKPTFAKICKNLGACSLVFPWKREHNSYIHALNKNDAAQPMWWRLK